MIVLIVGKVGSAKSVSDVLTVQRCRSRVPDDFTQVGQSAMTDRGRVVNMVDCFWSKCGCTLTRRHGCKKLKVSELSYSLELSSTWR